MSHIQTRYVKHLHKLCRIYKFATSHCNTLQHTATHIISHTATHICTSHIACTNVQRNKCKSRMSHIQMQHVTHLYKPNRIYKCATSHCNTLQHTATHCNTLQHTYTQTISHIQMRHVTLHHTATHCNTHYITHCNTHIHKQCRIYKCATSRT